MTISFNKKFVVLVNTQQSNLEETYDVIKVFFEVTISFNKKFVVLVNTWHSNPKIWRRLMTSSRYFFEVTISFNKKFVVLINTEQLNMTLVNQGKL